MRYLIGFLSIIVLLAAIPGGWYLVMQRSFDQPLLISENTYFIVENGATLSRVSQILEDQSIIDKASRLIWLSRFEGQVPILAAAYEFTPGMTLRDLYRAITLGESISDEVQITLVEGLTLEEMANKFVEKTLVESADIFTIASSSGLSRFTNQYDFLADLPKSASLEGYLFPDTYRFFAETPIDDLLARLLDTLDQKLSDEMLADIAKSDRSIHEVMTLASLVQSEVRGVDEMAEVAGILQNRLEIGMPLQLDSTINYLTKSGRDRSTFDDLAIDSPYNTYQNPGLPPGPISNPGLDAIKAAIYPAETDNLFFLTDKAGRVYYGTTLEEHNRNRQYLDTE